MDEDWTASHFSPSKARQQRAQEKDWEYVRFWLEKKFTPKPVPPFERNEETLKALLELASFNDAVDEEATFISDLQKDALKHLQEQVKDYTDYSNLTQAIAGALTDDGYQSLGTLAELSTTLNASDVQPKTLVKNVLELTDAEFGVKQECRRADTTIAYLEAELDRLNNIRNDLKSDAFAGSSELGQHTTDWIRGTKQLKAKVTEYNGRLTSLLETTPDKLGITDLTHMEADLPKLKERLKTLEDNVGNFEGLPHDRDLARLKVAEANQELQDLRKKRDRRFEGLVGS